MNDYIHGPSIEPPEPRMCTPGEHSLNDARISEEDRPNIVIEVICDVCGAQNWHTVEQNDFIVRWEL